MRIDVGEIRSIGPFNENGKREVIFEAEHDCVSTVMVTESQAEELESMLSHDLEFGLIVTTVGR